MDSLYYMTWGEQWSPVLRGQAGHVVDLLQELRPDLNVRLVAGISLRQFLSDRRAIKADAATAIVLPVFPGNRNWKKNAPLLGAWLRIKRPRALICRGPISASLMLQARDVSGVDCMICYDGRGARSAEIEEYSPDDPLALEMPEIEKRAVLGADWRIAVSNRLVEYWQGRFGYEGAHHTVIPCSLAKCFEESVSEISGDARAQMGWSEDDVVLVHSGGAGGWQHGDVTWDLIRGVMDDPKIKLLILSATPDRYQALAGEFANRVHITSVPHDEVPRMLSACDYGLLIREDNVTNQVASPVKFAEYLSCGLRVLISPYLGDFSKMLDELDLGTIVGSGGSERLRLARSSRVDRCWIRSLALDHFSKSRESTRGRYLEVVNALLDKSL